MQDVFDAPIITAAAPCCAWGFAIGLTPNTLARAPVPAGYGALA